MSMKKFFDWLEAFFRTGIPQAAKTSVCLVLLGFVGSVMITIVLAVAHYALDLPIPSIELSVVSVTVVIFLCLLGLRVNQSRRKSDDQVTCVWYTVGAAMFLLGLAADQMYTLDVSSYGLVVSGAGFVVMAIFGCKRRLTPDKAFYVRRWLLGNLVTRGSYQVGLLDEVAFIGPWAKTEQLYDIELRGADVSGSPVQVSFQELTITFEYGPDAIMFTRKNPVFKLRQPRTDFTGVLKVPMVIQSEVEVSVVAIQQFEETLNTLTLWSNNTGDFSIFSVKFSGVKARPSQGK